jgi:hypothetical protein
MKKLAPPEMSLLLRSLKPKVLPGLLPRNVQKLHHLPRKTVKRGMPPPKLHVLHLYNLKLIMEHLRLKISKSLELLGKRLIRICRAPLLKYRVQVNPK